MSELALPIATLIAAVALTYLFCVRPMRQHGRCAITPRTAAGADQRRELAQIEAARAELAALRAKISPAAPSADPGPAGSPPPGRGGQPRHGAGPASGDAARTG